MQNQESVTRVCLGSVVSVGCMSSGLEFKTEFSLSLWSPHITANGSNAAVGCRNLWKDALGNTICHLPSFQDTELKSV